MKSLFRELLLSGVLPPHRISASSSNASTPTPSKSCSKSNPTSSLTATKEAREKRERLELVRAVLEISEKLKAAREAVRNGRLRFAAELVRELKKALRVSDQVAESEPVEEGVIQEVLMRFMDNAVRFERESNRIRVKYVLSIDGNHGIELKTVLQALDMVGILHYGLAKVADLMIKHVISPALNSGSPVSFVTEINPDSQAMTEATLKIVPSNDPKGSWTRCFGRLTWPRISKLIISKFLSKVILCNPSPLFVLYMVFLF
ncbi:putative RZZ complex, subunit Zw10 protein [Rosa chinensis]|uniref:Putative RZZ complex, subunit Zw10 protein n=1 Tax=Rosa chinensis TaxID=74649 RepID=A0A2P6SQL7_ROSCH|nr:putative RZZ complex, subunit Zw10 protein [Rosa chinensis]